MKKTTGINEEAEEENIFVKPKKKAYEEERKKRIEGVAKVWKHENMWKQRKCSIWREWLLKWLKK